MQRHVEIGARILAPARSPVLRAAAGIARTHHEHWDGNGYLTGLHGDNIPQAARITAVADSSTPSPTNVPTSPPGRSTEP